MRPSIVLSDRILRDNAAAWARHAGVPVRAVIKSDGYGWGAVRIAAALHGAVDAFVVADREEFDALRPFTPHTIATLADTEDSDIPSLLSRGGLPNIATAQGLEAAARFARESGRPVRIRVGLRPAIGWAGFESADLCAHASRFALEGVEIELWTHLTKPSRDAALLDEFARAHAVLRDAGAAVVDTDIESSAPLGRRPASGSFVRVGVGLFGSRSGVSPAGVSCALEVCAPVVTRMPSRGQYVGYGDVQAPDHGTLTVVRCGYGDGFPRVTGTSVRVLNVGMQYTVVWHENFTDNPNVVLIDRQTDLDELARAAGVNPHEVVVRLGIASRNRPSMDTSSEERPD